MGPRLGEWSAASARSSRALRLARRLRTILRARCVDMSLLVMVLWLVACECASVAIASSSRCNPLACSLARFLTEERRSELMRSFKVQSPLYRDHADCPLADPELWVKWALWTPDKTGYLSQARQESDTVDCTVVNTIPTYVSACRAHGSPVRPLPVFVPLLPSPRHAYAARCTRPGICPCI